MRPSVAERWAARRAHTLTDRELQVLAHLAAGAENAQVARLLQISTETVKSHVRHILRKLEARTRTHAVAIAIRNEWI